MKITDLKQKRYRTNYVKDRLGNRTRVQEEYLATRVIKETSSGLRVVHFFVDFLVFALILFPTFVFVIFLMTEVLDLNIDNTVTLLQIAAYPLYYFILESVFGTTIGKLLTKSKVINEYGTKPSPREILLRSVIRIIPFEQFSFLSNNLWHDRWSKTWVVPKEEEERLLEELKTVANKK
jgi:uncharacterized RDD family membrane protein YckC